MRAGSRYKALRGDIDAEVVDLEAGALEHHRDEVLAELRPPAPRTRSGRQPGALRGRIRMAADFDAIGKTARTMNSLTHMEKWVRGTTPEYRTQLRFFENANEQIIRAADKENLDGAALAYVQLTLSCVNCHKVVRDLGSAKPAGR